uniref:aspartate carbamoyltransferase n=1 Tax=Rhizochromulina marina TaxID=1034831 RepID=A0A7S2WFS2_9STRA|mmetsp:Transcript_22592/g.65698  ORF Transcript_22592/g.65698 Transcript_22592/m.65698 type:complete len:282 (+) Transcript_22592:167-1012(+)
MEPSTRTSCSFQAAAQRLGATSILIGTEGSSAKKGETLEDTMRCLECYADGLVLRHPEKGSVKRVAEACERPVLNAGDGVGEHPTQALLDVYTMRSEFLAQQGEPGEAPPTSAVISGKKIALVGDLKHGRTVHSLATLLARIYPLVELHFVSPPQLQMPDAIVDEITGNKCALVAHEDLQAVIADADVLYITRVQKERFADPAEYEKLKLRYIVTPELMEKGKPSLVLMHPLPRVGEIDPNVDSDPRAAYFRQMENGMFVRMALLALVLGADVDSYFLGSS